jgi:competence protein ComEA
MEADPPSLGVATASSVPTAALPEPAQLLSPTGERSLALPSAPPPVWPRSAQVATALLLVVALVLLAWHGFSRQRGSTRPTRLTAGELPARIDLNRADRTQLLQLPGVGEKLADRILAYRARVKGFRRLDDLRRVPGVGPALMNRLRPLVFVESSASDEGAAEPAVQDKRRTKTSGKKAPAGPIDINRASVEELQRLPKIGPILAQRIVMARQEKPFRTVEDLRGVPGIGPKTLKRLLPFVTVGPPVKQAADPE